MRMRGSRHSNAAKSKTRPHVTTKLLVMYRNITRGAAVSYEQKIRGQQRLMVLIAVVMFIAGMIFMYLISMPPVWIEQVHPIG